MQLNATNKALPDLFTVFGKSKTWLVMKLTVIMLFTAFTMAAASGYSQKINLEMKNARLEAVFNRIEKISDYSFIYEKSILKKIKTIDVSLQNASLQEALNSIFKNQPLEFTIRDKFIVIFPKKSGQDQPSASPSADAAPQVITVNGVVKDTAGVTMPSVTVLNKNTGKATATNAQGEFKIDADIGDILVFSFVGFNSQSVTINAETRLTIILKETVGQLNAVVVTALGIKRSSKSLTYNVQEIKGSDVTANKDPNFVNSLVGKVAGVTINSSASGIGGAARVIMRGSKSLFYNNNALYVIDGIPMPSLSGVNLKAANSVINGNTGTQATNIFGGTGQTGDGITNLNPEDIETISVLTGSAAAALYGANAANGVILITTKKGANGPAKITFNSSTNFLSPLMLPKFQNTYGASAPGAFDNWGTTKLPTPSNYNPGDFFQTGTTVTNALDVSTGNEKNQTYISAASLNGRGIIPNNFLDRYNFTVRNTTSYLDNKLTLDLSFMYVKQTDQNMTSQGQYSNPLVPVYLFPRSDDITKYQVYERYNNGRNFKTEYWPYGTTSLQLQNPYWINNRNIFTDNTDRYLLTAQLKYVINKYLNITSRVKQDNNTNVSEEKLYASTDVLFSGPDGLYASSESSTKQTYADLLINFNRTFKDFGVNATIGSSLQNTFFNSSGYRGYLATVPNLFIYDNIDQTDTKNTSADQAKYTDQSQAIFGTASLSYKNLFFLDMTLRNDWSSALANTTNNSIYYPSIGGSAILSDLFKMDPRAVSYLKVRASYSEVGNSPERWITVPTYPISKTVLTTSTYGVPNTLQPERTKSFETGFNTRFLNSKLTFDFTYYNSNTYNQIFKIPTTSNLYGFLYLNAGKVNNYGIESSLGYNNKFGAFGWNTGVTFTLNRNKIIELITSHIDPLTGSRIVLHSTPDGSNGMLNEGGSIGDIYTSTLVTDADGNPKVVNGQLVINSNFPVKVGNTNPNYNVGFRNGFTYKGFNLQFLVDGRFGGIVSSNTQAILDQTGASVASAQARNNGGVMVNDVLLTAQNYYEKASGVGSLYIYSATNIRLRELSLGYTFPGSFFNNKLKSVNVAVNGRNLFFFYNHAPFDPESTASTGTYYQGTDYFIQPSLRSLGFSVNVQF